MMTTLVSAQQETIFSLYRHHLNIHNPAAVGLAQRTQTILSLRSQWVGVADAPETQAATYARPNEKTRLHMGYSILNDKTFVERQTQLAIDFAYSLPLGDTNKIYLGLKAGASSFLLKAADLRTFGNAEADPLLQNRSGLVPNIGVGFHYQSKNFYLAAAVPHLLNTERFSLENERVSLATDRPHFYINSAYRFSLSADWDFIPTLLWTTVEGAPSTSQYDFLLNYNNLLELGALFNSNNGIGGSLGIKIKGRIQIAYAYTGHRGSKPNRFSRGTHEIVLRLNFNTIESALSDTHNTLFAPSKASDQPEQEETNKG